MHEFHGQMVINSYIIFLIPSGQFGDWQTNGKVKIKTAQSIATVILRKIHENKDTFGSACVKCARVKRLHAFYALQDASVSVFGVQSIFKKIAT